MCFLLVIREVWICKCWKIVQISFVSEIIQKTPILNSRNGSFFSLEKTRRWQWMFLFKYRWILSGYDLNGINIALIKEDKNQSSNLVKLFFQVLAWLEYQGSNLHFYSRFKLRITKKTRFYNLVILFLVDGLH